MTNNCLIIIYNAGLFTYKLPSCHCNFLSIKLIVSELLSSCSRFSQALIGYWLFYPEFNSHPVAAG